MGRGRACGGEVIRRTDDTLLNIGFVEVEDILLSAGVIEIAGLDLDDESIHERTRVACLRIGIGVPRFFVRLKRR